MAALNSGIYNSNRNMNRGSGNGLFSRTKNFLGNTKGKINQMIGTGLDAQTTQMVMVLFVFIMVASLALSFFNPLQITGPFIRYVNVICFLLLSLFLVMIYLSLNTATGTTFKIGTYLSRFLGLFMSGFAFTLLAMLPMLIAVSGSNILSGVVLFIVTIILIVTTAIIIYTFFHTYLTKQTEMSYAGLLKNTILYIPCLLIDLVQYMRKQYNLTTKPVVFLLIFDIVFIIMFFNLVNVEKMFKLTNDTTLLKDPIYLNDEKVIGNYEDLKNANERKMKKEDKSYEMEIEEEMD